MIKVIVIFFILFFLFNVLLIIIDTRAHKKTTMPLWRTWYTWRHPIKKLETIWGNIRACVRRGLYGWSYRDVWDMDCYLGEIIPAMLRYLAANHCGMPMWCVEAANNDDEKASAIWTDWLETQARNLEWGMDEEAGNVFAEAYDKIVLKSRDEYTDEDKALQKNYYHESNRLALEKQKTIEETLTELGKHWGNLWD